MVAPTCQHVADLDAGTFLLYGRIALMCLALLVTAPAMLQDLA